MERRPAAERAEAEARRVDMIIVQNLIGPRQEDSPFSMLDCKIYCQGGISFWGFMTNALDNLESHEEN